MAKQLSLNFGAMGDKLSKQLSSQGFQFDNNKLSHFQKDVDALNRVRIRGLLPQSLVKKGEQKLFKSITLHLEEYNQ